MDRDWEDLAHLEGAVIGQPSMFVIGEHDSARTWSADAIDRHAQTLPGLVVDDVVPGSGHWLQREATGRVNEVLVSWLNGL